MWRMISRREGVCDVQAGQTQLHDVPELTRLSIWPEGEAWKRQHVTWTTLCKAHPPDGTPGFSNQPVSVSLKDQDCFQHLKTSIFRKFYICKFFKSQKTYKHSLHSTLSAWPIKAEIAQHLWVTSFLFEGTGVEQ